MAHPASTETERRAVWLAAARNEDEALVAALAHADCGVRVHALAALGLRGEQAAGHARLLVAHLEAEHFAERAAAAQALGRIGAREEALGEALLRALNDTHPVVRKRVIRALGQLRVEAAGGLLGDFVTDACYGKEAVEALGAIGSSAALEPLTRALGREGNKNALLIALGEIGDPQALPAILDTIEHLNGIEKARASTALRRLGTPEVLAAVLATDLRDRVRDMIPGCIGRGPVAREALAKALANDPSGRVRRSCAYHLGYCMDDPAVVAALQAACEDSEKDVRHFAQTALQKLADQADPSE